MHLITTFTLALILGTSFTIVYSIICIRRPPTRSPEGMTLRTKDDIRALLHPPDTSIKILLYRRAICNERLLRAFRINNSTFTSPSLIVHREFTNNTIARIRTLDSHQKWEELSGSIRETVEFYLPSNVAVEYAAYVQVIVLVTVLTAFFDSKIPFPHMSEARFVTEGINTLWVASKSTTFHSDPRTLKHINQYLHAWIPHDPTNPFCHNPLELILPAYETLWRLVAHAHTYVDGSPERARPFLDFFDSPTAIQFKESVVPGTPSAHDVIQEVLRLHPPTKRVKRLSTDPPSCPFWIRQLFAAVGFQSSSACSSIVSADIEALQRSSVWGPLPHEFDAMRHKASSEAQKEAMMPFGFGPLKCVAYSLAPRFAGLIVAGIAGRRDVVLTRGRDGGGRQGWGGWKITKEA